MKGEAMEKHVGTDQQIRSFKELQRAINEVIGHFWEDEVEDFANNYDENEIMNNHHIFCCLVALDNFVHENNRTPVQAAKDSGYFQEWN